MVSETIFGTDGIRGCYGHEPIHPNVILPLGYAIAASLIQGNSQRPKVVIGQDTRVSGDAIVSLLQTGLLVSGVDVYHLGVMPTPVVAFLTRYLNAQLGIVVTASHNPYQDNGIKFFDQAGYKLTDDAQAELDEYLRTYRVQLPAMALPNRVGRLIECPQAIQAYIEYCRNCFSFLELAHYKVVLDCANGATHQLAPALFEAFGAEVIPIHTQADGYNINQDCGATSLKSLQAAVLAHHAHCGIAFDGDGDRVIFVDEQGAVVNGDQILYLLATAEELGMQCGVVGTVMSNYGLEQALAAQRIPFNRTAVGDRAILAELETQGWTLGGEPSGHIINLRYSSTGDGLITALQLLALIMQHNQSLGALAKTMPYCPQVLINVPVTTSVAFHQQSEIIAAVTAAETTLGDQGRVLLRKSGTEACVRVMVEGHDAAQIQRLAQEIADVVAVVDQRLTQEIAASQAA